MGFKDTTFPLNDEDLKLLSDTSFFIAKQRIIDHFIEQYGITESAYQQILMSNEAVLPLVLIKKSGKISRGENYRGLPYIILDYPAVFSKEAIMAFRTLFWWGNHFSFTFHLSGQYLDKYLEPLLFNWKAFDDRTLVCINSDQWQHHHERDNYIPLKQFMEENKNTTAYFRDSGFIKLSKSLSLKEYQKLTETGMEFLNTIIKSLK